MILSCDWGTSSFRLKAIEPRSGRIIASLETGSGIAATFTNWKRSNLPEEHRADFYRAILQIAIDDLQRQHDLDLRGAPVVLSGMASASIGMLELPYLPLPFSLSGEDLTPTVLAATADFPHTVLLVPGLRSADDVMRGEETQLVGCGPASRAAFVDREGLFIFPGTHSKHIVVESGKAVAFKTYMTGEIFGLLARHSILAASVDATAAEGVSSAFYAGIDAAGASGLLHGAFSVRTNQLFKVFSLKDNYHYLSGLLVGEELKMLDSPKVTLIVGPFLRSSYQAALEYLGYTTIEVIDADLALVAGHCLVYERYRGGLKNP